MLPNIASSTDVEHAFSCGGLTVLKMRHFLLDESTHAASVLGSWCELSGAVVHGEIETAFKEKGKRPKSKQKEVVDLSSDDVAML
jgi:hypothetical protein